MSPRVLIAGVGNMFFGDDAFGVEVALRLKRRQLEADIEVADFGVRSLHLTLRLLEPPDLLLVADATQNGGPPGAIYVIEPDLEADGAPETAARANGHGMDVRTALTSVAHYGGVPPRTRIVGCEPFELDEKIGLSDVVSESVEPAIELLLAMARQELAMK